MNLKNTQTLKDNQESQPTLTKLTGCVNALTPNGEKFKGCDSQTSVHYCLNFKKGSNLTLELLDSKKSLLSTLIGLPFKDNEITEEKQKVCNIALHIQETKQETKQDEESSNQPAILAVSNQFKGYPMTPSTQSNSSTLTLSFPSSSHSISFSLTSASITESFLRVFDSKFFQGSKLKRFLNSPNNIKTSNSISR